jgi:hypothetical protein
MRGAVVVAVVAVAAAAAVVVVVVVVCYPLPLPPVLLGTRRTVLTVEVLTGRVRMTRVRQIAEWPWVVVVTMGMTKGVQGCGYN